LTKEQKSNKERKRNMEECHEGIRAGPAFVAVNGFVRYSLRAVDIRDVNGLECGSPAESGDPGWTVMNASRTVALEIASRGV
jgi:hypothetical protein